MTKLFLRVCLHPTADCDENCAKQILGIGSELSSGHEIVLGFLADVAKN
jgi:hypothetical protein